MSWDTSTIGLARSVLLDGETANLLGDKVFFFKGEPDEVVRLTTLGDVFCIGMTLLDGDQGCLVGELFIIFFGGEMLRLFGLVLLFLDDKRLPGLFDVLFFFLAGDSLRGTVAVLIAANVETMGALGRGISSSGRFWSACEIPSGW